MATREDVAREAARLLYNRSVNEYKDAKETAAASLGAKALPSNYEVATELDRLADEAEGPERRSRLTEMREAALEVMKTLRRYEPRLMGSVWRGTARVGSDIDVIVYGDPDDVERELSQSYNVEGRDLEGFTLEGLPRSTTHIRLRVRGYEAEVVVRPPGDIDAYRDDRCEIYGDARRGLDVDGLEKLMRVDPLRRFVPKRRVR
jgi:predicted nucleotidyltransferase